MRTGASSLHQALTSEAASIVKQSVILAKRRGHAQVTPLHVATTMLSSSTAPLRAACMQSHSHPLQCKALELCFNVALNRLPATTATTTNGTSHLHQHPSLSNALVAAFKRAQAHQRRGSIENQNQQPLLAVKVELEQLIISILDDPSVSRVMREAGFSSTQVKNNVELAVSLETPSSNDSLSNQKEENLGVPILNSGFKTSFSGGLESANIEDVATLAGNLLSRRKKCTAIVGESLETAENVVKGLMAKIDRGEIPEPPKGAQFITLPLSSYVHSCTEDVQHKLEELRCALKSCVARGFLLYVGDLKWAAEFRESYGDQRRRYFCPIGHIVFEVGRLVSEFRESGRFWLLGIASYQTFMRCRMGNPSLESLWRLQPLTVPAGTLELSLNAESGLLRKGQDDVCEKSLNCCSDCLSKFEMDAERLARTIHDSSSSSQLPSWLQQCKDAKRISSSNNLEQFQIRKLLKKWNDICNSIHKQQPQSENTTSFYFRPPSSSKLPTSWPHSGQASPTDLWGQNHLCVSDKETSILELPSSKSSRDSIVDRDHHGKFKQFNAESLKILCHALEQKAPQHKDAISEIASVVLQCRSGMMRRKGFKAARERKEDTWLLFEGGDTENKQSIARELANHVFFCHENNLLFIDSSVFSSLGSDENQTRKRCRQESRFSYIDKLSEAIVHNPHRVIFLEGVDQVDYQTLVRIRRAIERGVVVGPDGGEVSVSDAIIILSSEGFVSTPRASSPCVEQRSGSRDGGAEKDDHGESPSISLDLNLSVEDDDSMEQYCGLELGKYVDRRFVLDINGRAETRVSS